MRELSLHILDIVTNSLEAQASRVIIYIEELVSRNLFRISIRDNGRGMSPDMVEKVVDPFVTSRTTRSVGMGLPLLKLAAQQSGGDLSITSTVGKGTAIVVDFQKNSINRLPLGNMPDTVVNLIIGAMETHFCYIHRTDHGRFVFDSYWILARMAEKDCSAYDTINPAKEQIQQKLLQIKSTG
jgi:hypothetical protein